ncbi:MAG: helix-turn-helix domain-containing protein [Acidobacteria bacterium]|nr:helix-turn-helix domain-containing protein [Acidobacteriota bacterium]
MSEKVYFLEQAADRIGVDPKKLKDWLKKGLLVGTKVKTKWHIKESDLVEFLAKHPTVKTLVPESSENLPLKEKFIIPKAETLFWVYEERGTSCGLGENYELINNVVTKARVEDILGILENASTEDLGQVITCLVVIGRVLVNKPDFLEKAQKVLLKLMPDSRKYSAKVDNFDNHFIGMVGYLANNSYYDIVKKKKNIDEQVKDIIDGIYSVIKNDTSENIINSPLYTLSEVLKNLDIKIRQEKAKQIGDVFCEIIADKSRSSTERIKAYEAITWEISTKRETFFEQVRQKAANILVEVYVDSKEGENLRNYIKTHLNSIAPDAIEKLQQKGFLPFKEVPDIKDFYAYSSVDSSKVTKSASEVSAYEVLDILQNNRSVDIDKLLAAIYLAPIVSRRYNWRAFAYALTNLIFVYKEHKFKVGSYDVRLEISRASGDSLVVLLKERPVSDKNIILEYAWRAINLILDRGFTYAHSTDFYIWEIKNLIISLSSKEEVDRALQEIFLSTWRSPVARYLAYREGDWSDKELRQRGWEVLLDPSENPDLRALLGTSIHSYSKALVESLVDTSQKPWQLLPKSPENLPISNPSDLVAESWLIATLTLTKDYEVLRLTINHLAQRIGLDSKYTREEITVAREKVLAYFEKHPNLISILKQMCKKKKIANVGNIAIVAARMLALLGDPKEEETMIELIASGIEGWTTIKPFSLDWSGMNLLMTVLASNKVADNVYSCFEPYIIVGYGDEKARLMISRVFVLLAESYEKEGDKEKASRAYKWAIKRDGFNLSARQGLKKLEEN